MHRIVKFAKWLYEDAGFAQVGSPPAGNVSGMGDVVAPTATSFGSGDAWPSLGAPSSLAKLMRKKKRKRAKKIIEGSGTYTKTEDFGKKRISVIAAALRFLTAKRPYIGVGPVSQDQFMNQFMGYISNDHDTFDNLVLPSRLIILLMEAMTDGKYEFKVYKKFSPDDQASNVDLSKRWDLFGEGSLYALYFKEMSEEQMRAQSKTAAEWLQENDEELPDPVKEGILKLIRPEDLNTGKLKGMKAGLI
jgi:hypothetical protein